MFAKLLRFLVTLSFVLFFQASAVANESNLKVVASFSVLEDLVRELGGEHVSVQTLVGRNSDAHMYRPVPSDSVAIQQADLVVYNGLGFEGWITRLLGENGKGNSQLVASEGVDVLAQDGEVDPHAWQSFQNIRIYVGNISSALIQLMPEHADYFENRRQVYLTSLLRLEQEALGSFSQIPVDERFVVTSHDAFGYFGREFEIQFLAPLGLSLDAEASAEDVATVVDQVRTQNVQALFLENINNPRLLNTISEETGVAIGGRLFSDALSETSGPAGTYLDMMRHNIESLLNAFNSTKEM